MALAPRQITAIYAANAAMDAAERIAALPQQVQRSAMRDQSFPQTGGESIPASAVAGSLLHAAGELPRQGQPLPDIGAAVNAPARAEGPDGLGEAGVPRERRVSRLRASAEVQQAAATRQPGHVYFKVLMPDRTTAWAREGAYVLSPLREVSTPEGGRLSSPMNVSDRATSVTVTRTGEVLATEQEAVEPRRVGRLQPYTFTRPEGLEDIGAGLFRSTGRSGRPEPLEVNLTAERRPAPTGETALEEQVNKSVDRQRLEEDLDLYNTRNTPPGRLLDRDL